MAVKTEREILTEDMQVMGTVLAVLEGTMPRPDLSDKAVILAMCRCLWHILRHLILRMK